MQVDCDYPSIKRMLDSDPAMSHYYQKKVLPYVNDIQRELSRKKVIKYPKLNIREFADNFTAICMAYNLDHSCKEYYHSIMKQMNMAIYFSEKNKSMWNNNGCGINPSVYDMALNIITERKINKVINNMSQEIQSPAPFTSYANIERLHDLEECIVLIKEVSKDSTTTECVKSVTPPPVDPYSSEFGNY